ncbi:MAG: acyl-CoA thioesterase, partial [Flavobacteriaceae bacterium]|nr:acyl-CoA thioesterase [Flavobacteriaceae bacterium]
MKDFPPKNTVSHKVTFKVQKNEIDSLNHVNNVVYLQWVNDISGVHWKILSNDILNKKYFWVAIRHEIDYVNQAFLGDEITVYTWVGESKGVKSIRNVHIYKEGVLLVKAKTTWCLIDAKTNKLTRIQQDILDVLTTKK